MRVNQTEPDHINRSTEYLPATRNVTNTANITLRRKENRVISLFLYGANARYTRGAIENAKLIDKVFPGWKLRIYLPNTNKSRNCTTNHSGVPYNVIKQLKSLNVDLVFINLSKSVVKPMMWRFLVANDVTVDRFIVRDADSRLIPRDAMEVERWIQSGKAFHCMRDHQGHLDWPVSGGLWGAVPSQLHSMVKNNTFEGKMGEFGHQYSKDQQFLRDVVWPQVKHDAYCSDSFTCHKWESSHPFATNRSNSFEFVGEIIDGNGHRKDSDFRRIKKNPGSAECIPK